jgi:hypothetical protein
MTPKSCDSCKWWKPLNTEWGHCQGVENPESPAHVNGSCTLTTYFAFYCALWEDRSIRPKGSFTQEQEGKVTKRDRQPN